MPGSTRESLGWGRYYVGEGINGKAGDVNGIVGEA
jgi:hypothetical protein